MEVSCPSLLEARTLGSLALMEYQANNEPPLMFMNGSMTYYVLEGMMEVLLRR